MNTSDSPTGSKPDLRSVEHDRDARSSGQQDALTVGPPSLPEGQEADPIVETLDFAVGAVPEPAALTRGFTDSLPGQLPEFVQEDMSGTIGVPSNEASTVGAHESGVSGNSADLGAGVGAKPGRAPIRRPGWRFLMSHPAHWIALGFGSGLPWVMPGTFGTLFGWMAFVACMPHFTDADWFISIVAGFAVGVWACGVTGRNLGVSDHGSIVWDEIVAIWLVLWLVPQTLVDQVAAFIVFRTIDIVKPQPIKYFDARWKNGFGVMFDDLLAAFGTLLLFAVYYRFAGLPG